MGVRKVWRRQGGVGTGRSREEMGRGEERANERTGRKRGKMEVGKRKGHSLRTKDDGGERGRRGRTHIPQGRLFFCA